MLRGEGKIMILRCHFHLLIKLSKISFLKAAFFLMNDTVINSVTLRLWEEVL